MNTPEIKICGVNSAEALDSAIRARAAFAGFVFHPRSPRHLTVARAAELAARAEGRITRVGLFVDADDAAIAEAVAAARLDVIQLHGDETPARAADIKARFGVPVWKALPVASREDAARATGYSGAADLILFDAKTPKGALPGGMGLVFDWTLLSGVRLPIRWGLAGGLHSGNVAEAIRTTGASLVDTSSGVESAPGVKDPEKIAAFCTSVRSA